MRRHVSFPFLCAAPFVAAALASIRPLRMAGIYQSIGIVVCGAMVAAAWSLGARSILNRTANAPRLLAAGGVLLVVPYMLVALLWVGISGPWDSTPAENVMRYVVLVTMSIAVTSGFIVLRDALLDAGERFYSTLGFAANLLAGAAYLIWLTFAVGWSVVTLRDGHTPPALAPLSRVFDAMLFFAGVLTYTTTALFAVALGRTGFMGRRGTAAYLMVSVIASTFLIMRGLTYPDPNGPTPWFMRPGFIVGIPAMPWIMPFLLGVVVLRRAGDHAGTISRSALSPSVPRAS